MPEAAICVQDIDVQCVLQFTLLNAAGCALHRHTSRVIHRLELYRVRLSPTRTCRQEAFASVVDRSLIDGSHEKYEKIDKRAGRPTDRPIDRPPIRSVL